MHKIIFLAFFFSSLFQLEAFSQEVVLDAVKVNGVYTMIIKIDKRQLKTAFLNELGLPIIESGFTDSLSSDNYIYKKDKSGSGLTDRFNNSFYINKTKDSAIFQLENKSSYFKKNIGAKIDIDNWFKGNYAHFIKETDKIKKQSIAYIFYSDCPNCVKRLKSFDALNKKDNAFRFFGVMLDSSKSVIRFCKRNKFSFHFAIKQEMLCSTLPTGCEQSPFFLFIDDNGEIIDCFDGNEKGLEKIRQLLE